MPPRDPRESNRIVMEEVVRREIEQRGSFLGGPVSTDRDTGRISSVGWHTVGYDLHDRPYVDGRYVRKP